MNTTLDRWVQPAHHKKAPHPWRDPFFDGRWVKQAWDMAKGPRDKQPTATLEEWNARLSARLAADGEESAREGRCSGRGLYTTRVFTPDFFTVQQAGAVGEKYCHCFPGWFGDECEVGPGYGSLPVPDEKRQCVNDCNGRGVCRLNWCHCHPGTWGVDCSSGLLTGEPAAAAAASALAARAAAAQREEALRFSRAATARDNGTVERMFGGWGWPSGLAPPRPLPAASRALRIYVYDVPPRYNTWMAAHFRHSDSGRWDDSYLYSLDISLHRWLLTSPYRTLDPLEADYFLIPVWLSLGFCARAARRSHASTVPAPCSLLPPPPSPPPCLPPPTARLATRPPRPATQMTSSTGSIG